MLVSMQMKMSYNNELKGSVDFNSRKRDMKVKTIPLKFRGRSAYSRGHACKAWLVKRVGGHRRISLG